VIPDVRDTVASENKSTTICIVVVSCNVYTKGAILCIDFICECYNVGSDSQIFPREYIFTLLENLKAVNCIC